MRKKNVLYLIVAFSTIFLFSCLQTRFYVKVFRDGTARYTLTYSSSYPGLAELMAESMGKNGYDIIERGYNENGEYYIKGQRTDKLSSDVFGFLSDNEKTKNIAVITKSKYRNNLLGKTYIIDYEIGENQENTEDNSDYAFLYDSMTFTLIFEMPGRIVSTTGKITDLNKASYYLTFRDLIFNKKRIYIKSEENELDKLFNAQEKMLSIIDKNQEKINVLTQKIDDINSQIEFQKEVNNNIDSYEKKAGVLFVDSLNSIIDFYYEYYKEYPATLDDIEKFSTSNLNMEIPTNLNIIYDPNSHKVENVN